MRCAREELEMSQVRVVPSGGHPGAGETFPCSVPALLISSGLISPPTDMQGMWTCSPVSHRSQVCQGQLGAQDAGQN